MRLNVLNYESPQAVFDRAADGDEIYFPAEMAYVAPAGGWVIEKSLTIRGDGPGNPNDPRGTVIKPTTGNHVFVLDPANAAGGVLNNVRIHNLCISGAGVVGGGADGIHLNPTAGKKVSQLRIQRVAIVGMGGAGISLDGFISSTELDDVVGALISGCDIQSCGAQGIKLGQAFQVMVKNCLLTGNGLEGIMAFRSQLVAYACAFSGNQLSGGAAEMNIDTCTLARVDACRFDAFRASTPALFLDSSPGAGNIGACVFTQGVFQQGATGIKIGNLGRQGAILVLPNRFVGVGTGVRVESGAVACVVCPQYYDPLGGSGGKAIDIPGAASSDALLAIPSADGPGGNKLSGFLVPSFAGDPSSNLQEGMLAHVGGEVRVYDGGVPPFKPIKLAVGTPIADLVFGAPGKTTLTVRWTAPTDPCWSGPVVAYEIRYSTVPLNDSNFSVGILLPNPPAPQAPGTPQCARLTGLSSCATYYAAIKYLDNSSVWSVAGSSLTGKKTRCSGSIEVECTEG